MNTLNELNNNTSFNQNGIIQVNVELFIEAYKNNNLNWNGIKSHTSYEFEKIEENEGVFLLSKFNPKKADKTPTGKIKKSAYLKIENYKLTAQKSENWFQSKYK